MREIVPVSFAPAPHHIGEIPNPDLHHRTPSAYTSNLEKHIIICFDSV